MKQAFPGTAAAFLCLSLLTLGALPARAQLSVSAGGGWNAPRGDSVEYAQSGLRVQLGAEVEMGSNLGLELSGAYGRHGVNGSKLKADLALPPGDKLESETEIFEVSLAPKLYLLRRDISAYAVLGGGPRWLTQTVTTGPGAGVTRKESEQAWGMLAGFGVDAALSEQFRVGFAPVYHVVFAEHRLDYVAFLFYVQI